MNSEDLRRYIRDLQQSGFDVVRLKVQLQEKFAFPLNSLIMAVLAIPFALAAGKRGAVAGVATAVGIGLLYIMISRLSESMGNVSQLPPVLAAWAPDLLFGLAGGISDSQSADLAVWRTGVTPVKHGPSPDGRGRPSSIQGAALHSQNANTL